MRLRTRLILAAGYVLTVAVVGLEIPLAITINRSAIRETEKSLLSSAVLVAARINDDLPPAGTDPATPPERQPFVEESVRQAAVATRTRIVVVDALGRVVADSDGAMPLGTPIATTDRPEFDAVLSGEGTRIDIRRRFSDDLGQELLLLTAPVVHLRQVAGAVRISEPVGELDARVRRTWIGLGAIGLAAVLTGLVLAWLLAEWLARRVRRLADAAARLGRGDMEARAVVEGPGEVAALAEAFNRMAQALSTNIRAQQDFVANASHQLRTPLTGLQLRLEAIQAEGGTAGEQATRARAEVERLSQLVTDLLELARASSVETTGERLDLSEAAREAVDRWTGPAAETGKRIVEHMGGQCPVWANAGDVGHVLDNLLENSIRYTPEGTEITVETRRDGKGSVLIVSDTGPGIPSDDRDRLFERFYRGATGMKAGPGTGLGLAVVTELVHRWNGSVRLGEGPGTRIEATFPDPPTDP